MSKSLVKFRTARHGLNFYNNKDFQILFGLTVYRLFRFLRSISHSVKNLKHLLAFQCNE